MALYIVGGGISLEYMTIKAIQIIGRAHKIYVDTYTSIAPGIDVGTVRHLAPKAEVVAASRRDLEDRARLIVEEAKESDVVVLVPGDPLAATTHISLAVEAKRAGVHVEIVPGVSGLQAVIDATGLQVYKFGRVVTLVYPEENYKPYSTVETLWFNYDNNLHTLLLLDLRLDESKAMTIPEAIAILAQLEDELSRETGHEKVVDKAIIVGVARAGLPDSKCVAGPAKHVASEEYPPPPHSLVVVAPKPHPLELEALSILCGCKSCIR